MAHADYDCCAICDCKIHYNAGDSKTKEEICPRCIEATAKTGRLAVRPAQFIEHLKALDDDTALGWLHGLGFEPCYYENDVDKYLIERGLIETGKEGGAWGKVLRALKPSSEGA